jgi:predicted Zn-dependent peptidase
VRRCILSILLACAAQAQQVPVQEFVLENGMKLLMVPRKGAPVVAAGWVAKVGSVNERPGITGISHLFEHMMFKGTHVIGVRDIEEDLKINVELDRIKAEMRQEEQELARRFREGEIPDVKDPKVRTTRHQQLIAEFEQLNQREKKIIVKEELDRIYNAAGATSSNAGTSEDYTLYFVNMPANKLELWYWMESDRLLHPVFREFYTERDVVHEERRRAVDATPTGRYMEQFDAMFWKSSPYHWPVVGWPSDLEAITREDATAYYGLNYAPNNLAACLVGDFEPAQAIALAKKYFGRLPRGVRNPEPVRTTESPQLAEQRMTACAETNPQAIIRYHTIAHGHKDEPALDVLADLMNDRTGRLYKALVLDEQVANMASAMHLNKKYEGYFEFRGVAKPGKTPEQVEQSVYKQLEKLQKETVDDRELQKVKNRVAASNFRRLQSDFFLMYQLLAAEALRGWKTFNTDLARTQSVTAGDVQRVAKRYFEPSNRNVLIFYTKRGGGQ